MAEQINIAELIAKHQQLRTHLDTQTKAFDAYCKPYKEQMEQLQAQISAAMQAQGTKSLKTEFGTAILSEISTPKIKPEERDAYLDMCLENWDAFGGAMLQIGAPQVTAVKDYMDAHGGHLPPHIEMSTMLRFSIRKA